jgi:hypothetical protein
MILMNLLQVCFLTGIFSMEAPPRDGGPTLEVTQEFLKSRLERPFAGYDGKAQSRYTTHVNFHGCEAEWVQQITHKSIEDGKVTVDVEHFYQFQPSALYSSVSLTFPAGELWSIRFTAIAGYDQRFSSMVVSGSQETAEHIARAFAREIELCGGRKQLQ